MSETGQISVKGLLLVVRREMYFFFSFLSLHFFHFQVSNIMVLGLIHFLFRVRITFFLQTGIVKISY